MDKTEICSIIAQFICETILNKQDCDLGNKDKLISTGLIDSFSLVDISLFVEERFSVRIDDAELNSETFDTLDELSDLILSRR